MTAPDPLVVSWQGHQLCVRHDDPHLGPYTPRGATLRAAIELGSDVEGLRLVLTGAVGDHYRVKVSDDDSTVGLSRTCADGSRSFHHPADGSERLATSVADGTGADVAGGLVPTMTATCWRA